MAAGNKRVVYVGGLAEEVDEKVSNRLSSVQNKSPIQRPYILRSRDVVSQYYV